jgi:hypothetical protein
MNYFKIAIAAPHHLVGVVTFDGRDEAATKQAWSDAVFMRDMLDRDEPIAPNVQRVISVLRTPLRVGPWSGCPEILPSP